MYVEPELLEQLDEEQKQTLFIKMREEQVRRWNMNEDRLERMGVYNAPAKKEGRRIKWRTGRDGEVWVWVMGEHATDKTIEQIWEEEAFRKAREIAENEVGFCLWAGYDPGANFFSKLYFFGNSDGSF